jgi:hypothetical protein
MSSLCLSDYVKSFSSIQQTIRCLNCSCPHFIDQKVMVENITSLINITSKLFPECFKINKFLVCKHEKPFDELIQIMLNLSNVLVFANNYFEVLVRLERLCRPIPLEDIGLLNLDDWDTNKVKALFGYCQATNTHFEGEGDNIRSVCLLIILEKEVKTEIVLFKHKD